LESVVTFLRAPQTGGTSPLGAKGSVAPLLVRLRSFRKVG